MNSKHIYYSCSTWLSYQICQHYYGQRHYVWCSPFFDADSVFSSPNAIPPSSNPRAIYWRLKQDVDSGDLHSAKIADVRKQVAGKVRMVDIRHRASLLAEEYIISDLPRHLFDAIEL